MTSLFHISELGVRLKKGGAVCQARGQVGRKQAGAGAGGIQVRRRRVSVAQGGMLESEGDALGPLAQIPLRPAFGGGAGDRPEEMEGAGGLGPLFLIPSQGCEGPAPP